MGHQKQGENNLVWQVKSRGRKAVDLNVQHSWIAWTHGLPTTKWKTHSGWPRVKRRDGEPRLSMPVPDKTLNDDDIKWPFISFALKFTNDGVIYANFWTVDKTL